MCSRNLEFSQKVDIKINTRFFSGAEYGLKPKLFGREGSDAGAGIDCKVKEDVILASNEIRSTDAFQIVCTFSRIVGDILTVVVA